MLELSIALLSWIETMRKTAWRSFGMTFFLT